MLSSRKKSLPLCLLTTWFACTMSPVPSESPETLEPEELSDSPEPEMQDSETSLGLEPGDRVAYAGRFDWEDARQENGSYYFVNSLGYQFRIDTLYLATSSVQLRVCDVEEESSWLPRWGVAVAYADHVVEDDPSLAIVGKTEDAFVEGTTLLAVGTVGGGDYCRAFARSSLLLEPESGLGEHTLVVSGAYTFIGNEGLDNWTEFDASVPLTEGLLEDLAMDPAPSWQPSAEDIDASIVFVRYPVRAFQSVDPRRLLPVELAWEILGNLLHTSSVQFYRSSQG